MFCPSAPPTLPVSARYVLTTCPLYSTPSDPPAPAGPIPHALRGPSSMPALPAAGTHPGAVPGLSHVAASPAVPAPAVPRPHAPILQRLRWQRPPPHPPTPRDRPPSFPGPSPPDTCAVPPPARTPPPRRPPPSSPPPPARRKPEEGGAARGRGGRGGPRSSGFAARLRPAGLPSALCLLHQRGGSRGLPDAPNGEIYLPARDALQTAPTLTNTTEN